jgi:hypothetical protein
MNEQRIRRRPHGRAARGSAKKKSSSKEGSEWLAVDQVSSESL